MAGSRLQCLPPHLGEHASFLLPGWQVLKRLQEHGILGTHASGSSCSARLPQGRGHCVLSMTWTSKKSCFPPEPELTSNTERRQSCSKRQ